jgi:hypothetical protein
MPIRSVIPQPGFNASGKATTLFEDALRHNFTLPFWMGGSDAVAVGEGFQGMRHGNAKDPLRA